MEQDNDMPFIPQEAFRTPQMYRDYEKIWAALDDEQPNCSNYPEAYYPDMKGPGVHETSAGAKAMCQNCPALQACRSYGIKWEEFGIWGGMTAFDRMQFRRRIAAKRGSAKRVFQRESQPDTSKLDRDAS